MADYAGPERREYLTVREVAEFWSISDDAVYSAIRKGSLAAYRVGGSIRVRLRDALSFGRPIYASSEPSALDVSNG